MTQPTQVGIAWDPGVTSGYCIFNVEPFDVRSTGLVRWDALPATSWALIKGLSAEGALAIIISELYILYKHKAMDQVGSDFPSAQGEGILRAWAYRADVPIKFQPASIMDRVEILPEHEHLICRGERPNDVEHTRDAYKHARWWAAKEANRKRRQQR